MNKAPFVLVFGGQKGGSGKSTLAIASACELRERGNKVLLVDADRQGTARTFADVASDKEEAVPTVIGMGANMADPDQLPLLAASYDAVVIDCAGRDDGAQRAALIAAGDLGGIVLVPVGPAHVDIWALAETLQLVSQAQALKAQLRAALVINKVDRRTVLGRDAAAGLEDLALPVLQTQVSLRVALAEFPGAGVSLGRYAPRDAAAAEVRALVDEVLTVAKRPDLKRRSEVAHA